MTYRNLGSTGVQVSPLTLGAMMFGDWGNPDHDEGIPRGRRSTRRTRATRPGTHRRAPPPRRSGIRLTFHPRGRAQLLSCSADASPWRTGQPATPGTGKVPSFSTS
jgi:hypothetical protein